MNDLIFVINSNCEVERSCFLNHMVVASRSYRFFTRLIVVTLWLIKFSLTIELLFFFFFLIDYRASIFNSSLYLWVSLFTTVRTILSSTSPCLKLGICHKWSRFLWFDANLKIRTPNPSIYWFFFPLIRIL